MSNNFSRDVIQMSVAKILKHIGWDSSHQTSLEVLTDLLQCYIKDLTVRIHKYSELCGRTVPNLNDVAMVFNDLCINIEDMENYICSVKPPKFSVKIPQYPIKKESHLNPLRPGNREVITRPLYIHDHLPPMYPELDKKEDKIKNLSDKSCSSDLHLSSTSSSSLLKSTSRFNRCCDPALLDYNHKKKNKLEVGQPLREIKTIIMTASGYISSGVEGKFPENRIPSTCIVTSPFNSLETSPLNKSVHSETKVTKENFVNKRKKCMKNCSSKCKRMLNERK